jgi:hypothetical protein
MDKTWLMVLYSWWRAGTKAKKNISRKSWGTSKQIQPAYDS